MVICMKINRKHVKDTFQEYTDHYDSSDPKIKLKIDHTYRVAQLCERIAHSLGLSEEDIDLAWLSGMLHDIGRFEQLRRYNTFSDAQSIDHAMFAVELLYDEGLITDYVTGLAGSWRVAGTVMQGKESDLSNKIEEKDFSEKMTEYRQDIGKTDKECERDSCELFKKELDILREAIGNHSAYRIKKGLDERTQMFCHILRDADKIDIFRVICDTPMEEVYGFRTEDILQSGITPEVKQAFLERHAVLRSLKKQPADYIVAHGALVFELVYPESIRIAGEQGYLEKMMAFRSQNPDTADTFNELRQYMKEYLEGKSEEA